MMPSAKKMLFVNAGNSNTEILEFSGGEEFYRVLPRADFTASLRTLSKNAGIAAASVVPAISSMLAAAGAFLVSPDVKLPFGTSKIDISTVGADRLANAAALLDGSLPALSVDFGTAITFELVGPDGEFEGGAILPGRMLMRRALHDHTALLPLIPLADSLVSKPGTTTRDALRIGTDTAAIGAVREVLSLMEGQFPGKLRKVACGGDRAFFLRGIGAFEDGDRHTLKGIRRIHAENLK